MLKKFLKVFTDVEDEDYEDEFQNDTLKVNTQNKTNTSESSASEDRKIVSIFGNNKKDDSLKLKVRQVSIIRPKTFDDSKLISDAIKEKNVVTFSLEFLGFETGQRVIDFVSGTAYAMESHLSKITDKVFTAIPSGIGYEDIDTSSEEEVAAGVKKVLL